MPWSPSHFAVTAIHEGHVCTAKRGLAASAMCLADAWAEQGYEDIHITDPKGVVMDRDQFRSTMSLVRKLRMLPRSG